MMNERKERMMVQEPEMMLAVTELRITWVLDHPHISDWLKQALRTADGRDPIAMQNDVEMLRHLITPRTQAQIEIAMASRRADSV